MPELFGFRKELLMASQKGRAKLIRMLFEDKDPIQLIPENRDSIIGNINAILHGNTNIEKLHCYEDGKIFDLKKVRAHPVDEGIVLKLSAGSRYHECPAEFIHYTRFDVNTELDEDARKNVRVEETEIILPYKKSPGFKFYHPLGVRITRTHNEGHQTKIVILEPTLMYHFHHLDQKGKSIRHWTWNGRPLRK